jgi:hypothetical protein
MRKKQGNQKRVVYVRGGFKRRAFFKFQINDRINILLTLNFEYIVIIFYIYILALNVEYIIKML